MSFSLFWLLEAISMVVSLKWYTYCLVQMSCRNTCYHYVSFPHDEPIVGDC